MHTQIEFIHVRHYTAEHIHCDSFSIYFPPATREKTNFRNGWGAVRTQQMESQVISKLTTSERRTHEEIRFSS